MNNKGVTLIALIITMIVMIILAAIVYNVSFDSLEEATKSDINVELKNVFEVLSNAKINAMTGEFVPNEEYLATAERLSELGYDEETIEHVVNVNSTETDPVKKYYILDGEAFKDEFKGDINVSGLKRTYLVTYYNRIAKVVVSGEIYSSGKIWADNDEDDVGIDIVFNPDGNTSWSKSQSVLVTITGQYTAAKYLWTREMIEPDDFSGAMGISTGEVVTLNDETGNDWYLWVQVEVNGEFYTGRSEAFYIDNTAPEGILEII